MEEQKQVFIDDELVRRTLEFCAQAATVYVAAAAAVVKWVDEQNKTYERAAVKRAYSRRRDWKVSDAAILRTLPNARISRKRLIALEHSKKRGRPVVARYRSLPEALSVGGQRIRDLFDAETPPNKRLRALSQTGWWSHFAEALYRGCYAEAKALRMRAPAAEADRMAADSMGVSEATLRKLCQEVRKQRTAEQSEEAPSISLAAFEEWKRTRSLPE